MAERLTACNLCDSLCGLRVEVEGARVTSVRGDPDDPSSRGHLCPKAVGLGELLGDPDRLRHPLVRDGAGFRRASWDEALERAASPLRALRRRHGRDAIALYVGNPVVHAHGAALGAQLLTMALGTRNRFDPNSQDSNPRTFACMQVYGDPLAIPVPDLDRTHLCLMLGANPVVSGGSMMVAGDARRRLLDLRARGGALVVIDPRRTETAALASAHHFIRPGGDAALLAALIHVVVAAMPAGATVRHATRLDELRAAVAAFPPERVAAAVGIDAAVIRDLARQLVAAPTACVHVRVGVCQNEFGPLASWLAEALVIVTGRLGAVGGAMLPTPAADLAPLARALVGTRWARWRSRVRGLPEYLGALPSAVMAEEMETPGPGQIRALIVLAGNPVLTTPNGGRLDAALARLEHVVAIDYYLGATTRHAHVVLPPRHVFETGNFELLLHRFGLRNGVRYAPPVVTTDDDTRTDWDITSELALRLRLPRAGHGLARRLARGLPDRLVDGLLRAGPYRLSLADLREHPHGLDLGPLQPGVRLPRAEADLAPEVFLTDLPRLSAWVDAHAGPSPTAPRLVLIGRRHLRSNNSWMHNLPSLRKGPDRATLLVHPDDAARLGLVAGGHARVTSRVGSLIAPVVVTADVAPGVVSFPHGFGHAAAAASLRLASTLPGPSVNQLTDDAMVEPLLGTSILGGVPVTVTPAPAPGGL